jgi:bifunctional non-homologous end joining protein LigD
VFVAFDVLHVDGRQLVDAPYSVRRHELEDVRVRDHHWLTSPAALGDAASALYVFTLDHGWEGVVAKRLDSRYRPASRDGSWLKAKHAHARDLLADRFPLGGRGRRESTEPSKR